MEFQEATVTHTWQMTPQTKLITLDTDEPLEYRPGQHTVIRFEQADEVQRPYTMTNLPGKEKICLAIKEYEDGTASTWMCHRAIGDTVDVSTPKGNLYVRDYERDVCFVSTGTGATPMLPMLKDYLDHGSGRVLYFHGERTRDDLFFQETLENLRAEHDNLTVVYSLSDESWPGPEGHVQDHLVHRMPSFSDTDFYICGVPEMVVDTESVLIDNDVSASSIYMEGWEEDAV